MAKKERKWNGKKERDRKKWQRKRVEWKDRERQKEMAKKERKKVEWKDRERQKEMAKKESGMERQRER